MTGRVVSPFLLLLAAATVAAAALTAPSAWAETAARSAFSDWAAIFVAGDWHAHSGAPTEAFDNARRDVAAAFVKAGFAPANIREFSVRPTRYADTKPEASDPVLIASELGKLAAQAKGGCLVYMTSHGSQQGMLLGEEVLTPAALARTVMDSCGARPTVVVISACYSGVFLPSLQEPTHMVMTAARMDRSSFGCTESDKYPYFDDCVLKSLDRSSDFMDLAFRARDCIKARETAEELSPPSEPQVMVGPAIRPLLPLYPFAR